MNLTRLEWKCLNAVRKAGRPMTAGSIAITLDRRLEHVDAALRQLVDGGYLIAGRAGYRLGPAPPETAATRRKVVPAGFADGYGWSSNWE